MIKMTLDVRSIHANRDDFHDIVNGNITATIEVDNQEMHVGDFLKIYEVDRNNNETGNIAIALITNIYKGWGLYNDCIMLNFRYIGRGE